MKDIFKSFVPLILICLFVAASAVEPQVEVRKGHGVWWDDLRFPAQLVLTGPGSGNAADRATDGTLLFASNQDEEAFVAVQMPHSYILDSVLHPHIHWAKTTSAGGDVCIRIDYDCKDIGETFANALGTTLSMSYIIDDEDTAWFHALTEAQFNPLFTSVSGICLIRIWRDVSGDGGTCVDDYAADLKLYEFDLHYQFDQPGSFNEYTKY